MQKTAQTIRNYPVTRFSEIEGNNTQGWRVVNLVTGIQQDTVYPTYEEAKEAALFVGTYYRSIE